MRNIIKLVLFIFIILVSKKSVCIDLPVEKIKLTPGFNISVYSPDVPDARSLAVGNKGTLFVGTRYNAGGRVYAILDKNNDYVSDEVVIIAEGLNAPNGVAFFNGDLYVAETHRVIKFPKIETNIYNPSNYVVVNDSFPTDKHHGNKFIRFGPDNRIYIPVGAPCNVCKIKSPYATLMRMNSDGKNLKVYLSGIRNTVGFDWHPRFKELWFTDNGRDFLSDELPPDELNRVRRGGSHYGFPYVHGNNIRDPEFGKFVNLDKYIQPEIELDAHVAALGMRFYKGKMFPKAYRNQVFIAEHGSWNRSKKIGYRISVVKIKNYVKPNSGKATSYRTFAEGWLQGEKVWGRPVDIEFLKDGSMVVSDDHAGAVYRITYNIFDALKKVKIK